MENFIDVELCRNEIQVAGVVALSYWKTIWGYGWLHSNKMTGEKNSAKLPKSFSASQNKSLLMYLIFSTKNEKLLCDFFTH